MPLLEVRRAATPWACADARITGRGGRCNTFHERKGGEGGAMAPRRGRVSRYATGQSLVCSYGADALRLWDRQRCSSSDGLAEYAFTAQKRMFTMKKQAICALFTCTSARIFLKNSALTQ